MTHKFAVGQEVYFAPGLSRTVAQGTYKILSILPVENDDRRRYRIKNATEPHERIAEESQLSAV
ncbi:MAG TPA: hypothetical protein VHD14_09805 [Pseudolabrys sp.]|jgi:hypothetical protein|nr:hypothetical protein [Pseudolabrys sp.]